MKCLHIFETYLIVTASTTIITATSTMAMRTPHTIYTPSFGTSENKVVTFDCYTNQISYDLYLPSMTIVIKLRKRIFLSTSYKLYLPLFVISVVYIKIYYKIIIYYFRKTCSYIYFV